MCVLQFVSTIIISVYSYLLLLIVVTQHHLGQSKGSIFMYLWLWAHARFDVTCFPAFVRAPDVISSVLSKSSLTYRQILKWRRCPTKRRECSLCPILQVRITNNTQKIQSSDWPKWRCTLWRNVNSCVFVRHRTSFLAFCRYVNCNLPSCSTYIDSCWPCCSTSTW